MEGMSVAKHRKRRPNPGWWMLGWAAAWTSILLWQRVVKPLTPASPQQALLRGYDLTRRTCRVLAIAAHQDDLELFVGGTLRLLALAGSPITALIATDGHRQYAAQRTLSQVREQEERDAATIVGYSDIRFLRNSDLELSQNPRFEDQLRRVWQDVQPDLVLASDPTAPFGLVAHPDHLAVGRATLNIARSLGQQAPQIVFYASRDPNLLVDISQVIEDKKAAIRCHKSQLKGLRMLYPVAADWFARWAGRAAHVPRAEPLRAMDLAPIRPEAFQANWSAAPHHPS